MAEQELVESREGLLSLAERLEGADVVALDTEFHGERRYWPELFLVQLADEAGPVAVDPLAVEDLSPLGSIFGSASTVKVIHSAYNDVAILRRALGVQPREVFDTQLAAAFVGYGEQRSLDSLLQRACGVRRPKGYSMTDWSARPLSEKQLGYALDDVRYLLDLYGKLRSQLEERGRMDWFRSESKKRFVDRGYGPPLESIFARARSKGKVRAKSRPILWKLVKWRERLAQELDKPRNRVIRDDHLARIASMSPDGMKELSRIRGLPGGFVSKWAGAVLKVVAEARESPPDDVPTPRRRSPQRGSSARRDILRIYVREKARQLDIVPALLLPKEALQSICAHPPDSLKQLRQKPGMTPWRMEILGNDIMAVLAGRKGLVLGGRDSTRLNVADLGHD